MIKVVWVESDFIIGGNKIILFSSLKSVQPLNCNSASVDVVFSLLGSLLTKVQKAIQNMLSQQKDLLENVMWAGEGSGTQNVNFIY